MATDYYKTLQIGRQASQEQVYDAFRRLAIKLHPSKQDNKEDDQYDQAKFERVCEAFHVLGDPQKRAVFDYYGVKGLIEGVQSDFGEKESYPGGYTFNQAMAKTIFEKFFGGPNPYDGVFIRQPKLAGQSPFDAGLDGVSGMKQWKGKIQKRCEDKVHKLMVTLEELYSGAYKKASLQRQVIGKDGQSIIQEEKIFPIEIKQGWRAGTKIIFNKEGNQAFGYIAGDVVFVIEEAKHAQFKRSGNDLHFTYSLPLVDALVGVVAQVPTLDGRVIHVSVPEVITYKTKKIVLNEGMPLSSDPSRRGNLVLSFDVQFPSYLTEHQKETIKQGLKATQ